MTSRLASERRATVGSMVGRWRAPLTRFATYSALLYVHLWVAEGALRKWVPGAGEVMYIARDVALIAAVILLAFSPLRARRGGGYIWAFAVALGAIAACGVIVNGSSVSVAVAGLRSYLGPFLLPYIAFSYGTPDLYRRLAKAVLVWVPVQLVLGIVQATSPPSAAINLELSGEETRFVHDGIARITGTFTAPSGLTSYTVLAFALALAAVLGAFAIKRSVSALALAAVMVITMLSGSRGTILGILVVLGSCFIYSARQNIAMVSRFVAAAGALLVAAYLVVSFAWPQVLAAFLDRFAVAGRVEDSQYRLLDQTFGFLSPGELRLVGSGVGSSSIVGISLGSGQTWVEIESKRWVVELGILGVALGVARLLVGIGLILVLVLNARRLSVAQATLLGVLIPAVLYGAIGQNPSYQAAFGVAFAILLALRIAGEGAKFPPTPMNR